MSVAKKCFRQILIALTLAQKSIWIRITRLSATCSYSLWVYLACTFIESKMWSYHCGNQRSEAVVTTLLLLFLFSLICLHPSFSCYTGIVSYSFFFLVQKMPVRTWAEIFITTLPKSTLKITSSRPKSVVLFVEFQARV